MKDQVDNLKRRHIRAVFLHSGMTMRESHLAQEKLLNGNVHFLYISPERLSNERFITLLRTLPVKLIVADEAHCISQWGYDFRPAYLRIKKLRQLKPGVPVLALTATATPEVAKDICEQLEMKDPRVLKMSFSRSNLNYLVRPTESKIHETFHILSRTQGSSIVYVRSRKRTREIAEFLASAGISATYYHAGLDYVLKEERQNAWQRGETRVMVATNAFGMGIDKPDVRVVVHYDLPPSLEEYYQEAGRAGRDGLLSYAVLLTRNTDKAVMKRRISEAFPEREVILKIYERACNYLHISLEEGYDKLYEFDLEKFCETFGYQDRQVVAAFHILARAGYMEYLEETDRRSRVMITSAREELYHLDGLSREADRTLQALLRGYTGLFSDYVPISEERLMRDTGLNNRQIYESLLELGRTGMVNFIPRSATPLMHMLTRREEPRYVTIGRSVYEARKENLQKRIEAMLHYAFAKDECREQIMLEYFGENGAERCGRCDTCRQKRDAERYAPKNLIPVLSEYFDRHPQGVDIRILEAELPGARIHLAECLSFLCDEGYIRIENGIYYKR
jgi:ATP-dependent DNA helicase RecQ